MSDSEPQAAETNQKPDCTEFPDAPSVPEIPERGTCPQRCDCPDQPGGEQTTCFETLIRTQNSIVAKADRAKKFAEDLTAIQDKVKSALVDYTKARFKDLRKTWKEQDDAIVELIPKLVCAVNCWDCLIECHICKQLADIRRLEDRLWGAPADDPKATGKLTSNVYSLFDKQAWHQRNVTQMTKRMERITAVLKAWENPSTKLGEVLDSNGNLIKEVQNLIASDAPKAVYDVFMTLIPRHWAIRPRDTGPGDKWKSHIDEKKYVRICECPETGEPEPQGPYGQEKRQPPGKDTCKGNGEDKCQCDEGIPDECCYGADVGILSLRQRLIGAPLPYLVDPGQISDMICCITTNRLSKASDQLAAAEADLAAAVAEIEQVRKQIDDKMAGIEATFRAELPLPFECGNKYPKNEPPPTTPRTPGHDYGNDTSQSDRNFR